MNLKFLEGSGFGKTVTAGISVSLVDYMDKLLSNNSYIKLMIQYCTPANSTLAILFNKQTIFFSHIILV